MATIITIEFKNKAQEAWDKLRQATGHKNITFAYSAAEKNGPGTLLLDIIPPNKNEYKKHKAEYLAFFDDIKEYCLGEPHEERFEFTYKKSHRLRFCIETTLQLKHEDEDNV